MMMGVKYGDLVKWHVVGTCHGAESCLCSHRRARKDDGYLVVSQTQFERLNLPSRLQPKCQDAKDSSFGNCRLPESYTLRTSARPHDRDTRSWMNRSCSGAEVTAQPEAGIPWLQVGLHPDNFSPVDEIDGVVEVEKIQGTIPQSLVGGAYIRNGGNHRFSAKYGSAYHYFDGDGMLHCIYFKGSKRATYSCRYTRTSRFLQESAAGQKLFPRVMSELHGLTGLAQLLFMRLRSSLGLIDTSQGLGTANAGLAFFNNRLLCMSDDDAPYVVALNEMGEMCTRGRYTFGGSLHGMIAHPKQDPVTKELICISWDVGRRPCLKVFSVTPQGFKSPDLPIHLPEPILVHDFAITHNFAIIPDQQLVFRPQQMLQGQQAFVVDPRKRARYGIVSRSSSGLDPNAPIRWVQAPEAAFCMHFINAWEETPTDIVIIASCIYPFQGILTVNFEQAGASGPPPTSTLYAIRLNLATGASSKEKLAAGDLDIGQFNHAFLGRKHRFVYMSMAGPWPRTSGIVKVDVTDGVNRLFQRSTPTFGQQEQPIAHFRFPDGCFGNEPFFVPSRAEAEEDDGFILCLVHNERTGISECLVLDAKSPTLQMVATLRLPRRVPYGFHGLYLSPDQLASQFQ